MAKKRLSKAQLRDFLEAKYSQYNRPEFIDLDPVSIPHRFSRKQDIEIAGLFAAVLAWGQRVTILRKCSELMEMMDNSPYEFVLHHSQRELKMLTGFKHRTFNATDTLWFIHFLQWFYQRHSSLSEAFPLGAADPDVGPALIHFQKLFFHLPDAPGRTQKHIATPERNSTCKRLTMYLRWMVRKDEHGVDFGIWNTISPAQLVCPCDLHVDRVARALGLIRRKQTDWLTALELTENLRLFDPSDPVKYDFALFGLGISEGFGR